MIEDCYRYKINPLFALFAPLREYKESTELGVRYTAQAAQAGPKTQRIDPWVSASKGNILRCERKVVVGFSVMT
jgi:hypothetical protein